MPTDSTPPFRRRVLWSVAATLLLAFVSSTSTLSTVHRPQRSFSLGLDETVAAKTGLGRLFSAPLAAASSPGSNLEQPEYLLTAQGSWHLRPNDRGAALGDYVRSLPFGREIDDAARRHEIDALLLASVVEAESSFRPDAVSTKGALGLMQLMPLHFDGDDLPFDPEQNLDLGARYLDSLRERFDGDLELALAAYHAGPGTVERYGGAPPFRETRLYVDRVMALYREHREHLSEEPTL